MKRIAKFIFSASVAAGSIFGVSYTPYTAMAAPVVQAPSAQQAKSSQQFILQAYHLAAQGKVTNSEFGLGTKKDTILKKWGNPDYQNNWTLSYKDRGVLFGIEPISGAVIEITSMDPRIKKIPTADIKKALGSPAYEDHGMGHVNLVYENAGTDKNQIIYHGAAGSPELGYNLSYIQLSIK